MAEQVNTQAVVTDYDERTGKTTTRNPLGHLILAVRVDDLPKGEADRLAAEGKFHPFTVDKDGNLRVTPPVEQEQLIMLAAIRDLLVEIRDLGKEQRDLLMQIA